MLLIIKKVLYLEGIDEIKFIRTAVFQEEQGVEKSLEFDGLDAECTHMLAYWDDKAVGTSRIREISQETAKIERLAVLKPYRGLGIGKELMKFAIKEIEGNQNYRQIVVNAQEYVKLLYEKLGFETVGDRFDEAGIPHVKMIKRL
ncbi:MAG: Acetyltransferase [Chroococcopsis gigantea SAG 12.99]|jgi:predicted GNAT family N-acyltransferase|nr:GNAT family N-acetyltransferase [Chlorogloea purpurea SAG 13.99]MDV2999493.1 Acetyltransferase [Chroococcopsis gigantea SAG 12.99]